MINIKDNTEPWCNPTWTRKSSLVEPYTLSQPWAFLYINYKELSNHSPITKQHPCEYGYVFSKSTNGKGKSLFWTKYFFCLQFNTASSSTYWHESKLYLIASVTTEALK